MMYMILVLSVLGEPAQVPEPTQHALAGRTIPTPAPTRCGCDGSCPCDGQQGGVCDCASRKPAKAKASSVCSTACTCGCNEGEPCHCNAAPTLYVRPPVTIYHETPPPIATRRMLQAPAPAKQAASVSAPFAQPQRYATAATTTSMYAPTRSAATAGGTPLRQEPARARIIGAQSAAQPNMWSRPAAPPRAAFPVSRPALSAGCSSGRG